MAKSTLPQDNSKNQQNRIEMIGRQFGRLTVIQELKPHIYPSGGKRRNFRCKCDCGTYSTVTMNNLCSGKTNSCGCLRIQTTGQINRTHGLSKKHPLYGTWSNIKNRCYNENTQRYKDYGSRGISVCGEWKNDFMCFYNWAIDNGWNKSTVIDRKDNDGDYSPENCRFVDYYVSARNRRLICSTNTSGYHGVSLGSSNKWLAYITYNKQQFNIGRFDTPEEAARAYDNKATELDSNYPLNFPNKEETK